MVVFLEERKHLYEELRILLYEFRVGRVGLKALWSIQDTSKMLNSHMQVNREATTADSSNAGGN